jgi:aerobic-type carbon monoxide dehydrogenase small subunit (CoxS/CutS family)
VTSLALASRGVALDRETIRDELAGVLCRCTGYQNIVSAVESYLGRIGA